MTATDNSSAAGRVSSTPDSGPQGGPAHPGHDSKALAIAWVAVVLMIIGFGLVVLALPVHSARVPLLIVGGVVGLAGIITGAAGGIMNNVE